MWQTCRADEHWVWFQKSKFPSSMETGLGGHRVRHKVPQGAGAAADRWLQFLSLLCTQKVGQKTHHLLHVFCDVFWTRHALMRLPPKAKVAFVGGISNISCWDYGYFTGINLLSAKVFMKFVTWTIKITWVWDEWLWIEEQRTVVREGKQPQTPDFRNNILLMKLEWAFCALAYCIFKSVIVWISAEGGILRLVGKTQLFIQSCYYLQFSAQNKMYFLGISKPALLCLVSAVKPEASALAINHRKSHSGYHCWPSENCWWGQSGSKTFVAGWWKLYALHPSPAVFSLVLSGRGLWVLPTSLQVLGAQQHFLSCCDSSATSFPEFGCGSAWPLFSPTKFNRLYFLGTLTVQDLFLPSQMAWGQEAGKGTQSCLWGGKPAGSLALGIPCILPSFYTMHASPLLLAFPQHLPSSQAGHTQAMCWQTSQNSWHRTNNFLLQGGLHIENNTV